jgi:putative membrane protein
MHSRAETETQDLRGDPRVFFAAQRTMLAWIRTGVALMGFGFVVARFGLFLRELAAARGFPDTPRMSMSVWAGTTLLLIGVAANALAAWRYRTFAAAFRRGDAFRKPTSTAPELALTAILAALGILLAGFILRAAH